MSLIKSTIWLVSAEIIFTLSSYIINAGLGRMLGPADYGRYSIVIGFTTMIIIFVGRSVPTAMTKRLSEHPDDAGRVRAIVHTAAIIQGGIIALLTALFYFAAPLVARTFGDPSLAPLLRLSTLIIPAFALSSFHVLFFNGTKRFGAMTALKMSRGVFRMLWILGLAYAFHLNGALTGAILAPLCVFGVALLIDAFWTPRAHTPGKHAPLLSLPYPPRKILTYAGGFMLFTLFYEFYVRTDIYLIKAILGDDAATGLYNAAMTVALIPYYLLFAVTFMLFPTISTRTTAHGNHGATQIVTTALRFVVILLVPSAVVLAFFAQPLVTLFFGASFAPSATLVPLMLGGTVFGTLFFILAAVLNGAGYTRITATITALAIAVSIVTNIIFLPQFGIVATAATFSATSFFMGFVSLIAAHHLFHARIPRSTLVRVPVAALCMIAAAFALSHTGIFFIISIVVLLILYVGILAGIGELTSADIAHITRKQNA